MEGQPSRQTGQAVVGIFEDVEDMVLGGITAFGHDEAEFTEQAAYWLIRAVRSATTALRMRCKLKAVCCSTDLTGTKRMAGRLTASQMASVSLPSFLPLLLEGTTKRGGGCY